MKNIKQIIFFLILAVGGLSAQDNSNRTGTAADETAIRGNVEQMVKGWNTKSGSVFAERFAEDADYVVINGRHLHGRSEIAAGHSYIFAGAHKSSTLEYTVEQVRYLRTDLAVVHVLAKMTKPGSDLADTFSARITMVMAKDNGKWQIAAFQNTSIQEDQGPRR